MHQRSPRTTVSRAVRGSVAVATAGLVLAAGQSAAMADEHPAYPSQSEVDSAQERVRDTERSVEAIRGDLAAAADRLDSLAVQAAQASEAYNGAVWELRAARQDARKAQRRADQQDRRLDRQRREIGGLVAQTYQNGSSFGQINAYLTSKDSDRLLDQVSAYKGASDSLLSDFDRLAAQRTLASVYRDQAEQAVSAADDAAAEAERAKQAATNAVAAQEQAVAAMGERRDELLRELAEAQDISVELATQRQEALEELERQRAARAAEERAEAERRREARQAAAREEQREAQAAAQRRSDRGTANQSEQRAHQRTDRQAAERGAQRRAQEARERRERRAERRQRREERRERREQRQEQEQQEQPSSSPPPSSGGAQAAISFAYAQLGEPYEWGAAGPNRWDCSGLTMKAWAAAGRSLPHNSGMQYRYSTPISYGQLRRGDLIFWSSNGSSSGIYHVGLYIGDDQMIHAPNPDTEVKVSNIWYMGTPSHYGRV